MKEVISWEIMDSFDWGLVESSPTPLSNNKDMKLSTQEEFVKNVLDNYEFCEDYVDAETWLIKQKIHKADAESLLKSMFDDANKVITQNSKWDVIPDYNARAKLKLELLRAAGIIKPKQTEIKINFLSLLFWNK